jgi:GDPmannose 4,6-dehydratase
MRLGILTGVTGQDGSYLAELLITKGYTVWGLIRTSSHSTYERIQHLVHHPSFSLKKADLQDTYSIQHVFDTIPEEKFERIEIYNLGAQSHVRHSFDMPEYTAEVDALGVLRILECIRRTPFQSKIRFYQASTSELYGNRIRTAGLNILNESSGFEPCSPYAVSKLFAYWSVRNYREGYGIFACNGILFNHESPRRGVEFVTRKISIAVGKIRRGEQEFLELGNLDALRDWGHARDYVEGMWKMLQREKAEDWVLATGENHSVREFVVEAFSEIGYTITWEGNGVDEVGKDQHGIVRVKINPEFFRPNELHTLLGDPTRSKVLLEWQPKTTFKELVREMVDNDLNQ